MALWDEIDVLVTPGTATTAIGAGAATAAGAGGDRRRRPVHAVHAAVQPHRSAGDHVPAGFGADGLPLSVQLVGRLGAEDVLYSLAGQIEAAAPWVAQPPRAGRQYLTSPVVLQTGGGRGEFDQVGAAAAVRSRCQDHASRSAARRVWRCLRWQRRAPRPRSSGCANRACTRIRAPLDCRPPSTRRRWCRCG